MKMFAVIALALAFGCGGADNPAPTGAGEAKPGDRAAPQSADHRERDQLYFDIAREVDTGSCDEFAAKLTKWVGEHGPRVRELEKELNAPVDIDEHLVDAFEEILGRASDCVDSDQAQAAFEAFDELFMGS